MSGQLTGIIAKFATIVLLTLTIDWSVHWAFKSVGSEVPEILLPVVNHVHIPIILALLAAAFFRRRRHYRMVQQLVYRVLRHDHCDFSCHRRFYHQIHQSRSRSHPKRARMDPVRVCHCRCLVLVSCTKEMPWMRIAEFLACVVRAHRGDLLSLRQAFLQGSEGKTMVDRCADAREAHCSAGIEEVPRPEPDATSRCQTGAACN